MKNPRNLCVAVVLTLMLTVHTFAGQMHTLSIDPPPPSADGQMETGSSEAVDPATQVALSLLQSVMSLF